MKITAEQVTRELKSAMREKAGRGKHGMTRQNEINERFYIGDQWHGAGCGDDRPLVRQNVIRRIADYKMSVVGSEPTAVTFAAEGVACNDTIKKAVSAWKRGETADGEIDGTRMAAVLSDQFMHTAERVQFDHLKQQVLLSSYITGTGVLYTYWDDTVKTGLFADTARTQPISGDIACEVLHIDNVFAGDAAIENLQDQPYILITQQKSVESLQKAARRFGGSGWRDIRPAANVTRPDTPPKATVITRFWKEADAQGVLRVYGMQVADKAIIRPKWCLGISRYPLATFRWTTRSGDVYGESEITHLIPNQIAINRMLTAGVWSMMMTGMPIMVVNGDVVTGAVTNDPGQIIPVYGSADDVDKAIHYVEPPAYSSQFTAGISTLISDTLSQAGVNSMLTGEVRPDNASAIMAAREMSLQPLKLIRNRFFTFCEDVARIWVEFWARMYGTRPLKIEYEGGVRYVTLDMAACENMLWSVKVDVAESVVGDQATTMDILNRLFEREVITARQYVSRLPAGSIPRQHRLLQELQEKEGEYGTSQQ